MRLGSIARHVLVTSVVLACAGCTKEDGSKILGRWRAERFEVMSLKLPIGPELTISRDKLIAGEDLQLPIQAISQHGDEVTLDSGNVGFSFYFVEPDRMYLKVPLIDRIYYRRVAEGGPRDVKPEAGRVASPAAAGGAADPALGVLRAAPAGTAPGAEAYELAEASARRGDGDAAVRHLHQAFQDGFRDARRVKAAPEFALLRSDVRYQALLSRYDGQ
jgi:hypothetical protein